MPVKSCRSLGEHVSLFAHLEPTDLTGVQLAPLFLSHSRNFPWLDLIKVEPTYVH